MLPEDVDIYTAGNAADFVLVDDNDVLEWFLLSIITMFCTCVYCFMTFCRSLCFCCHKDLAGHEALSDEEIVQLVSTEGEQAAPERYEVDLIPHQSQYCL